MFSIIPRYLAFSYIVPFLVSSGFFTLFLLMFQMFRVMRLVMSKGVEFSVVMELLGHIALSFVPMAIPLAILFSTIYTLSKLSSDSEFIAMRSIGLTKEKLFVPFLIFATLIGLAVFALNSEIIPYSKREFRRAVNILGSKGLISQIQEGNFFTEIPGVILFAEKVEGENILKNVFINIKGKGSIQDKVIFSKTGELIKESDSKWGAGEVRLVLREGSIVNLNKTMGGSEKILFKEYDFPISRTQAGPDGVKARMKSSKDLWAYINRLDADKMKSNDDIKAEVEYWSRINIPFLIIVFTLLGFSLGVQRVRGRGRNSASIALAVLVGYYVVYFSLFVLTKSGGLPAWFSVFFPTILGAFVGLYFFKKLEWIS